MFPTSELLLVSVFGLLFLQALFFALCAIQGRHEAKARAERKRRDGLKG